jgi:hypothetical protein
MSDPPRHSRSPPLSDHPPVTTVRDFDRTDPLDGKSVPDLGRIAAASPVVHTDRFSAATCHHL